MIVIHGENQLEQLKTVTQRIRDFGKCKSIAQNLEGKETYNDMKRIFIKILFLSFGQQLIHLRMTFACSSYQTHVKDRIKII